MALLRTASFDWFLTRPFVSILALEATNSTFLANPSTAGLGLTRRQRIPLGAGEQQVGPARMPCITSGIHRWLHS
jgi:hypothetical protein